MLTKFFKMEWFWGSDTERWLKDKIIGYTLNFPCGLSKIGDLRADIDPKVKPDIIADIRLPEQYFQKGQFDTVICDPPFSFYALNKIPKWIFGISVLAKKRLIFRAPMVRLYLDRRKKDWKREYYLSFFRDSVAMNMFHVFTETNHQLINFS